MIKNLQSKYVEDKSPSQTWYKIKGKNTYDGIVMGYDYGTPGTKYETWLGTLKVYQYCNGVLLHTSDVGGLTETERKEFKIRLDKGEQFVVEFEAYGLFEDTHKYRHPSFKRIRTDKNEKECIYGKA
jgi:ATP-dependent DNA ligase